MSLVILGSIPRCPLCPFILEMCQFICMAVQALQAAQDLTCKVLIRLPLRYRGKLTKLLYFVTTSAGDRYNGKDTQPQKQRQISRCTVPAGKGPPTLCPFQECRTRVQQVHPSSLLNAWQQRQNLNGKETSWGAVH
jgi:hypothetical protein